MQGVLSFRRVCGSDRLHQRSDCLLNFRFEPMIDIWNAPALGIKYLTSYVGDLDRRLLKVQWPRGSFYTTYQASNWVEIDPNGRQPETLCLDQRCPAST